MSEKPKDGGPAFPAVFSEFCSHRETLTDVYSAGGMSLRDYFAAKAMPELLRDKFAQKDHRDQSIVFSFLGLAETAYELADAMLKARDQ